MRKVILSMQMTLDGIIEAPKEERDSVNYGGEETWDYLFNFLKSADTFLVGRVMYPEYENHWSSVLNNPSSPENEIKFAKIAEKTPHILFSSTIEKVSWENTRIVKDNIREEILKLKQQPGKNMVMWGGAALASSFMNLDLIDEYSIIVNPIILGHGKPLFKNLKAKHNLKLIETKTFKSGMILLYYESIRNKEL